jgi:CheY-like chemotaxis protein
MCLVVIVDDRATNRAIYSQLARSIGQDVEVVAFGDPEEALNWLAANRASLIVTDYDMPRIVGDEFISRFRSQPHSVGVPIMMVTV